MFDHSLPTNTIRNIRRTVRRTCMLILSAAIQYFYMEEWVIHRNWHAVNEQGRYQVVWIYGGTLSKLKPFFLQTVQKAVRAAREANIFMVFVILDNPANRDSILDIRVPIFRPGKPPEIKSYLEQFPFPFYIILRDINALPQILSDALRQWFEFVSSLDWCEMRLLKYNASGTGRAQTWRHSMSQTPF